MKRKIDVSDTFARLMGLFEDDLAGVSFPDVDVATMRDAATRCEEQQSAVEKAEALLANAKTHLEDAQSDLAALTHKTIAYLRVYAADDQELSQKIDNLDPKKRKGASRRRPRPTSETDEPAIATQKDAAIKEAAAKEAAAKEAAPRKVAPVAKAS